MKSLDYDRLNNLIMFFKGDSEKKPSTSGEKIKTRWNKKSNRNQKKISTKNQESESGTKNKTDVTGSDRDEINENEGNIIIFLIDTF